MMNFNEFKSSEPARSTFEQLGLISILDEADTWPTLRRAIVRLNDRNAGRFVLMVKKVDRISSSGERVLLHAICRAADFAWLADELADGRAWRYMENASGEWRHAVAACILCRD